MWIVLVMGCGTTPNTPTPVPSPRCTIRVDWPSESFTLDVEQRDARLHRLSREGVPEFEALVEQGRRSEWRIFKPDGSEKQRITVGRENGRLASLDGKSTIGTSEQELTWAEERFTPPATWLDPRDDALRQLLLQLYLPDGILVLLDGGGAGEASLVNRECRTGRACNDQGTVKLTYDDSGRLTHYQSAPHPDRYWTSGWSFAYEGDRLVRAISTTDYDTTRKSSRATSTLNYGPDGRLREWVMQGDNGQPFEHRTEVAVKDDGSQVITQRSQPAKTVSTYTIHPCP